MVLEGPERPNPGGINGTSPYNPVPITVRFFKTGDDVTIPGNAAATYVCDSLTAVGEVGTGSFGTCILSNVIQGRWDITVVAPHTLTNVKRNYEIKAGTNTVDLGTLLEGDADENGGINVLDVTPIVNSVFKSCGEAGYNSKADFDNNCNINILDIGLFVGNVFKVSPIEVP